MLFHLCQNAERTRLLGIRLHMLRCKLRIRKGPPDPQHHRKGYRKTLNLKTKAYKNGINQNPRARRHQLINVHIYRPFHDHPIPTPYSKSGRCPLSHYRPTQKSDFCEDVDENLSIFAFHTPDRIQTSVSGKGKYENIRQC